MIRLPRLALATPPDGPEPAPASLAMMAGLARRHWRIQHFRARACPTGTKAVGQITGLPGRHLDGWLMPEDVCRSLFARGACRASLALVEGTLEEPGGGPRDCTAYRERPGALAPLARALDLPTIALVACPRRQGLHLPTLPPGVDAVLLDGLEDPGDYAAIRDLVALVLKRPVIGAVEALPGVRDALRDAPRDAPLPEDLVGRLAASFLRFADLRALRELAEARPFDLPPHEPRLGDRRRFRVAYAQDEAFGKYFPDTLETLEALGASMVDFSPLRDEALPDGVDLVMVGCGFPDDHAAALAANVCMLNSLRAHVCRGQRIYSEGGGTAYLGRFMVIGGRTFRGAGILPVDAELLGNPAPPYPVSRVLTQDGWLGRRGATVRGYHSGRWRLHVAADPGDCPARSGPLTDEHDIVFRHHAVGSLIHLHLAALPEVVSAFAGPHTPSLALPTARR